MHSLKSRAYHLLRRSESFFKTDMVYLAKGGFWLTLGQGLSSLSSLILAIAFANLVSKEIYGNYKYILSVASVIGAFSLTGISSSIIQAVARGYEGALQEGYKLSMRWSSIMVIVSAIAALYYYLQGNHTLGTSLLIAGAFSPLLNSASLYASYLNGKKDFKNISLWNTARNLVPVISLITTLFITDDVILLVFVYFISNTFAAWYLYKETLRKYKPNDLTDPETSSFGKHLSIINVFGTVGDKIDSILLFHFFGAAPLSVYSFATAVPNQIIGFVRNAGFLALPKLAEGNHTILKKEIIWKMFRFVLTLTPLVILYALGAPYIYKIIFPQYTDAIQYSRLYSVMILFAGMNLIPSFFDATLAVRERYISTVSSNVIRIILMTLLVVPYGIWGLIWAQIITKSLVQVIGVILLRRL
jgi:O-antigen/teichoic acid export membrane protein